MKICVGWATTFSLGVIARSLTDETCNVDNFGVADSDGTRPVDYHGQEQIKCQFKYHDLDEENMAVMNWYPDSDHFNAYKATDMIPKRHWEYPGVQKPDDRWRFQALANRSQLWKPGLNGPLHMKKKLQMGECEVPQEDGGAWHVQRLGPFVSDGNYDWWQVGLRDVFRLSKVFEKHPEGVFFSTTFSAGVTEAGEPLGFPPIHIHHIHVSPQPGVKKKIVHDAEYITNVAMEQHGDYQCLPNDGGVNCFYEKPAKDHFKEVHTVFDLEGELNDVRAANAGTMTWWYQIAMRWHPKSIGPKEPLSQLFSIAGNVEPGKNQLDELKVFYLNTHTPQLFWYAGQMPSDGDLARLKPHGHNVMYDRSYWFRASPEELGLIGDDSPFPQDAKTANDPIPLKDLGMNDFESVEKYLFDNLRKSAQKHSKTCDSFLNFHDPKCEWNKPFAVCHAWSSNAKTNDGVTHLDFEYDRRAQTCCKPWKFKAGEVFTTIGFYHPLLEPLGPSDPRIPLTYPQHLHWIASYKGPEAKTQRSFYSLGVFGRHLHRDFRKELVLGDALMHMSPSKYRLQQKTQFWPDGRYKDAPEDDENSFMQTYTGSISVHYGKLANHSPASVFSSMNSPPAAYVAASVVATLFAMAVACFAKNRHGKRSPVTTVVCQPPCCPCIRLGHVQKVH
jgi:hypothetical protein